MFLKRVAYDLDRSAASCVLAADSITLTFCVTASATESSFAAAARALYTFRYAAFSMASISFLTPVFFELTCSCARLPTFAASSAEM